MNKKYLAGFFDGEGCIYVYKHKRNFQKYHTKRANDFDIQMRITIANTNKKPLFLTQQKYGGSIQIIEAKGNRQTCYTYHLAALKALKLLKDIFPYLIVRKEKAKKAIFIQKWISSHKCKFIKGYRGSYLSSKEWKRREQLVKIFRDDDVKIEDILLPNEG